jgi:hypothetical protein
MAGAGLVAGERKLEGERRVIWGVICLGCSSWVYWGGFYTQCGRRGREPRLPVDLLDKEGSGAVDGVAEEVVGLVVVIPTIRRRHILGRDTIMAMLEQRLGGQGFGVAPLEELQPGTWQVIGVEDRRQFHRGTLVGLVAAVIVVRLEEMVARVRVLQVERDMRVPDLDQPQDDSCT